MITDGFQAMCCGEQYDTGPQLQAHLRELHPRGVMRQDQRGRPLEVTYAHGARDSAYLVSQVRLAPSPLSRVEREWLGAWVRTPVGEVGQVWCIAQPGSHYQGSTAYRGYVWVVVTGPDANQLQALSTEALTRLDSAALSEASPAA